MSEPDNGAADEMRINPERAKELVENLKSITQQIHKANKANRKIRLIAVSKLKPPSDILSLHRPHSPSDQPQLHFGENYYQELLHKSSILPSSVRWHFIGALQTNKCKPLAENVRGLWCVSSVDSAKKADGLEKGKKAMLEKRAESRRDDDDGNREGNAKEVANGDDVSEGNAQGRDGEAANGSHDTNKLRVHVQVNTSGEESKSGVEPARASELCRHIIDNCPHLQLAGLMTIGAIARSATSTPETENEDFDVLRDVRDRVAQELNWRTEDLELSMGMSGDFEAAIAQDSDEVRVGTGIFGERQKKGDAQAKSSVEEETG